MTKQNNDKNAQKLAKNKKHKIFRRVKEYKGVKSVKKLKIRKFRRIRRIYKKIVYKKKKKHSLFSKTNFSDTSSADTDESSHEYKNELLKIINNISIKYKIKHNICENNINNKINYIISHNKENKINIILDIDQTLVFSQKIEEKEKIVNINNNDLCNDNYYIEFYLENKKYNYFVQVRKGLKDFILKLSPFCNFYVNTMANPVYIKEVLILLNKKYNLNLCNSGINNVFITSQNNKKTLPPEITKNGNFLILDDNICVWDKSYLSNIIPVRKFFGHFDNNINSTQEAESLYDTIYQYYFFTNKIYCFNEKKRENIDLQNKLPFCSEASWSDNNQLYFIGEIIIKTYILNKLINIPVSYSFFNIINNVLKDCKIYYDGEDKKFFQDLVLLLGGKFVLSINDATYILIKESQKNCINEFKNKDYTFINIKWLFDCYFSFIKLDVDKYKIL